MNLYRLRTFFAVFGAAILSAGHGSAAPTHLVDEAPLSIMQVEPGVFLVDFGRVAFGNLRVRAPLGASNMLTVYFGESMAGGRIDRQPRGMVRYNVAAIVQAPR